MSAAAPITVVGSVNRDIVVRCHRLPRTGETVMALEMAHGGGGKGANQAVAAARLGGRTAMIGCVGADAAGIAAREALAAAGCDVAGLTIAGDTTGRALVLVDSGGANAILVVPGANAALTEPALCAHRARLDRGGIMLLQLETPLAGVVAAAAAGRSGGARVILDPAPMQPLPGALVRACDIITPNRGELAGLCDRPDLTDADIEAAARSLAARGGATVIVKLGADGCLLVEPGAAAASFAAPRVTAVDTTGAGDVFNGALAVALAERRPLAEACRFAVAAAAISVTRPGAQAAAPDRREVEAFLQRPAA